MPGAIMTRANTSPFPPTAAIEGRAFKIPRQYDYYLSDRYGKYMVVPPVEKQVLSVYSELDFGIYQAFAEEI